MVCPIRRMASQGTAEFQRLKLLICTPKEIASLHLEATKKEASAATDDVSPVKHHKRKVVARQRNNNYRYGNVWGYAQAYRNDPRGFFIH